ncbi:hypothetical protein CGGC5_v012844 [Colletotrichum fructicola Nara gc5]|uniref:DUF7704 domain-containing protein n=1 Tax=Colletotrichum fructicola (strain Nara gc5) TaxID=1213859 RepID=A0A7J6ISY8_COLFN|nr:hypothetical protein CFRS1_v001385 [Colletotrichum fructicola]KAF4479531.1 hypothetical protein CGGC5_v012844 [Colletotrichum fructicola Nara gc5]KAF5491080.1 hypothetical protein CGCF413_v011766 [Colletotrichum fructicola]
MSQIMPPIPRIFFTYIEPLLCLFGALQPLLSPSSITAPLTSSPREPTPTETLWALQNAVLLFGFALLTWVIMLHSNDRRVVRGYVLVSALMDFPHWGGAGGGVRQGGGVVGSWEVEGGD